MLLFVFVFVVVVVVVVVVFFLFCFFIFLVVVVFVLFQRSVTLTSCVSENKSLAKVSKASMEVSTRLPAILHRKVKRNAVQIRECSLLVSILKSGPPFSGKKKLSRRQHIVVTLFMST